MIPYLLEMVLYDKIMCNLIQHIAIADSDDIQPMENKL